MGNLGVLYLHLPTKKVDLLLLWVGNFKMYLNRITVSTFITTVGAAIAYYASAGTMLPQIALFIGLSSLTILGSRLYQEYKQQKRHAQNIPTTQQAPLEPIAPRVDNGLRGKAKNFFEEIQSRNSLLGLNELALADELANECLAYVFLRYEQLGQANFDETYPDLDTLIIEVLNFVGDNRYPVADIARKLGFNDAILAIMEANPREVEDERSDVGGKFRRHEHAFHAQFQVLSEIEKQQLLKYTQLIQTKHNNILGADNLLVQAQQIFGWLADFCQNFRKNMTNIDKLIIDIQAELAPPSVKNTAKVEERKEQPEQPSTAALNDLFDQTQPGPKADAPSTATRADKSYPSQEEMARIRRLRLDYFDSRRGTPTQNSASDPKNPPSCHGTGPDNSQKPSM